MSNPRSGGGYGAECGQAYLDHVAAAIEQFALSYSPSRQTLILFPGGLGSKLLRDDQKNTNSQRDYYTSWIEFFALLRGEPRKLQILPNGDDVDRHYVIPDGYIDRYVHAYEVFASWCRRKGVQLLVYGFDWRRSSQDAADFFLDKFLPAVDSAIARHHGSAVRLVKYSLVGHSLGGMALKLAVNNHTHQYVQNMDWAVTVAAPFYGYGGQIRRYLYGIKELNWSLAQPSSQNQEMARIIGTMPGGYEFVYLAHQTYKDNKTKFEKADPDFPLMTYPSVDPSNNPIDPYCPPILPSPGPGQPPPAYYPFFRQANFDLLHEAAKIAEKVAAPLAPGVAARFFNIRGVQCKNGKRLKGTVVSQVWKPAPGNFNPDAAQVRDPINDINGYGDGVQPAWGTRLLQMHNVQDRPDGLKHVLTIEADIDHVHMMNYTVVQNKLALILGLQPDAVFVEWLAPQMASPKQFDAFLLGMPKPRTKRLVPEAIVRAQIVTYLMGFTPRQLRRFAWRGLTDYLKGSPPPNFSKRGQDRTKNRGSAKQPARNNGR
jgi:hypothetical protein